MGGAILNGLKFSVRANAPYLAALALYSVAVYLVATAYGFPIQPQVNSRFLIIVPLLTFIVLWAMIIWSLVKYKPERPLSFVAGKFREWRLTERVLTGLPFLLTYPFLLSLYTSVKFTIGKVFPFYADPWLVSLDPYISPPQLLPIILSPIILRTEDLLYFLWFPINCYVFTLAAFTLKHRARLQYLVGFVLSWALLGNFVAVAVASAGPCFMADYFDVTPFAEYLNLTETPTVSGATQDFLRRAFNAGEMTTGVGISAFPSMHVGIAILNALFLRNFGRAWFFAGATFAVLILISSISLGWHYALDGYFMFAAVPLVWWLSGWIVDAFSVTKAPRDEPALA